MRNVMFHYSLQSICNNRLQKPECFPSMCQYFLPTSAFLSFFPPMHPGFYSWFFMVSSRLIRGKCLILQLTGFLPSPRWLCLQLWQFAGCCWACLAVWSCWCEASLALNRLSPGSDVYVTVSSIALARSQQCRNSPSNLSSSSDTGSTGGTYRQKSMPEG